MPLISQSIPNLFNGISQQAAALRLPSQAELQENAYSTIVDGLQKRYPLVHKAALSLVGDYSTALVRLIRFDVTEKYVLIIKGTTIKVFDINGTEKTVNAPDGTTYLASTDSFNNMECITIADYTFIVNKLKTVLMSSTPDASETPTAVVWIKNGVADTDYTVDVNGNICTYTTNTTSSTYKTTNIASQLTTLINAIGGYTATQKGSLIKIVHNSGLNFDFKTSDSWGDQACVGFKGTVQKFGDLPAKFFEDITIEITGESKNKYDSMYVEWIAEADDTTGTWKETVSPGLYNDFDATTLPHNLIKNIDGTFTFQKATWSPREVGDEFLTPEPSFVDRKINQVFFYKNRLGFLSGENIILSRDGEYFNFYPETTSAVLDTDPIDITAASAKVSNLEHAVPFDESLIVLSQQTQFSLNHDKVLSPKTVSLDVTTEFESSGKAVPVTSGQNMYFPVERKNYSGIREYYVDTDVVTHDAADITAHCPNYIPANVYLLASSSNEDLILCVSRNEPNVVYVYKYYWNGNEKVQSCWSRWVFGSDATIIGMNIFDSEIFFVIQRTDDVYIESMDVAAGQLDGALGYLVLLDRKVELTGSYDSGTELTTWTLPYAYDKANAVQVITSDEFGSKKGRSLSVSRPSSTTVTAVGDHSAGKCIIGIPYTMRYRLSEQFVKDNSNVSIQSAKLMMRNLIVSYVDTGYFRVEVSTKYGKTYKYPFTGKVLGAPSFILGEVQIDTGTFRCPISLSSKEAIIDIVNDSFVPSQFQSAEWEALYTIRNRRQ